MRSKTLLLQLVLTILHGFDHSGVSAMELSHGSALTNPSVPQIVHASPSLMPESRDATSIAQGLMPESRDATSIDEAGAHFDKKFKLDSTPNSPDTQASSIAVQHEEEASKSDEHSHESKTNSVVAMHDSSETTQVHPDNPSEIKAQHDEELRKKFSAVANALFKNMDPNEVEKMLEQDRKRFEEFGNKIDESVDNRNVIYLEDGEMDDHWQSLMGALNGHVPKYIVLRGGYWKVRAEMTSRLWDGFTRVSGQPKPIILTIHGILREHELASFDKVEGVKTIHPDELAKLRADSLDEEALTKEVEKAKDLLVDHLRNSPGTTFVVKCAPTGLADAIVKAEAKEKVAVIWTGTMRYDKQKETFEGKFNVKKDIEASGRLFDLNVPTFISTPRISYAQFGSIAAKELVEAYKGHSNDVQKDYEGFDYLHQLVNVPPNTFTHMVTSHQDDVHVSAMDKFNKAEGKFAGLSDKESGTLSDDQRAFFARWKNQRGWDMGGRWIRTQETIDNDIKTGKIAPGAPFRDFCPIDQYANLVLDKRIRQAGVQEVIAVHLKVADGKTMNMEVTPSSASNKFIITKSNSDPLAAEVQKSLFYMLMETSGEQISRQTWLHKLNTEYNPTVNKHLLTLPEAEDSTAP